MSGYAERTRFRMPIEQTWDGSPIGPRERVDVTLRLESDAVVIEIDAPFHGDPPPPSRPGPTEGLWDYEVVEVFLLGREERYLEVEMGPLGHHLVLQLRGARRVERSGLPLDYRAEIRDRRWRGVARVPVSWLPPDVDRANAYAIHGQGGNRRYLAWRPVPGVEADFHRLDCFGHLGGRHD
jgi:hypothetical protein